MAKLDVIGGFESHKYRSDEGWIVGYLDDGTCITGNAPEGTLVPGMIYQFFGDWYENDHGKQFGFEVFVVKDPNSRPGVVAYLEQYAPNIGIVMAGKLYDAFGGEAVKLLRGDPVTCARACNGNIDKFKEAAAALQRLSKFEDTKIKLTTLFHGRGLAGKAIEACIARWGILAPERISKDPFCMLVERIPGAGFERCNALYKALGLSDTKLKRLMICMWHTVRSDRTGSTWMPLELAINRLRSTVSDEIGKKKLQKIIRLGTRSKWLSIHKDENGQHWMAEKEKAISESYVAKRITDLLAWVPPPDETPATLKDLRANQMRTVLMGKNWTDEFADL